MKTKLLAIALATVISSTASAQMSFQSGSIDASYYFGSFGSNTAVFSIGGRADYDMGALGFQLDGSALIITDFSQSLEEYSLGAHLYKELNDGTKLGGFIGADSIDFFGPTTFIYNFGVEGIKSFGAFDVEASISGYTTSVGSSVFWRADIDGYYEISPAIEISAGVSSLFSSGSSLEIYNVGATYTPQNVPLSIGVEYSTSRSSNLFSLSASFAFGGPTEERLFKNHTYPLLQGGI